jgi:hypothetical protein
LVEVRVEVSYKLFAQTLLEPPSLPISISQLPAIIGVCHHAWPEISCFLICLLWKWTEPTCAHNLCSLFFFSQLKKSTLGRQSSSSNAASSFNSQYHQNQTSDINAKAQGGLLCMPPSCQQWCVDPEEEISLP